MIKHLSVALTFALVLVSGIASADGSRGAATRIAAPPPPPHAAQAIPATYGPGCGNPRPHQTPAPRPAPGGKR
jgi:hypothetical protein